MNRKYGNCTKCSQYVRLSSLNVCEKGCKSVVSTSNDVSTFSRIVDRNSVYTLSCSECKCSFKSSYSTTKFCGRKCRYQRYKDTGNKYLCSGCSREKYKLIKVSSLCETCHYTRKFGSYRKKKNCKLCGNELKYRSICDCAMLREDNASLAEKLLRLRIKEQYLDKDIKYNYRPDWLLNPKTGYKLEIDVALPELKVGYEFDGRYHFTLEEQKDRDLQKNLVVTNNGWVLIRISNIKIVKSRAMFTSFLDECDRFYETPDLGPPSTLMNRYNIAKTKEQLCT